MAESTDLSQQLAEVDEVKAAAIAYAEKLCIEYEKHGTTKGYYAGAAKRTSARVSSASSTRST